MAKYMKVHQCLSIYLLRLAGFNFYAEIATPVCCITGGELSIYLPFTAIIIQWEEGGTTITIKRVCDR